MGLLEGDGVEREGGGAVDEELMGKDEGADSVDFVHCKGVEGVVGCVRRMGADRRFVRAGVGDHGAGRLLPWPRGGGRAPGGIGGAVKELYRLGRRVGEVGPSEEQDQSYAE